MTDPQGAQGHDRPQPSDPDATPVRGVPAVPPVPEAPPAGVRAAGNPFAPPSAGSPSAVRPPAATPPAPPTASRPPRRAVAWTAGGVAAALVVVAGGLGVGRLVRDDDPARPGTAPADVQRVDLGAAEFDDVLLDVAPTHEFSLPIEWALEDLPDAPTDRGVVQVFADQQLTIPATDAIAHVSWDGTISVSPPNHEILAFVPDFEEQFGDSEEVTLNAAGEWGVHDRYFIAEYRDRATGEPLPEPRVTAFTVDDDEQAVQSSVRVDDDGVAHFSWDAVEGADEYYMVRADDMGVDVIGTTSGTTWSSIEQDADVQAALAATEVLDRDVYAMNQAFTVGLFGEDDAVDGFTDDGLAVAPGFGVVAVVDGEVGPLAVQGGADLVSRLPAQEAFNAAEEMGVTGATVKTLEQLPTSYPVSLADGSTVVRPVTYDADAITEAETWTGTEDDAGNVTITGSRIDYRIPYRVVGTMFTDTYTVRAPDMEAARAGARAADERAAAARARTGDEQSYVYVEAGAGDPGEGDVVSRVAPEVPYQVNGSNPLTTYLAANLVAGERYVDVSAFVGRGSAITPTGVSLWDAFDEALAQNPMALAYGRTSVGYSPDQQLLSISYTGFDSEAARVSEQESVAAAVQDVVGRVVTDGMSDRDKAVAIGDYLAANAEYDYAALDVARQSTFASIEAPHAFVATGVLVDGLGVCASYAQAYKALADAAGLEAVYVTGTANASGEGHAWNKVKVDGAWRVVDPTWNDSSDPNRYLLQTDAEAAGDRTEDTDWMLDSRVAEYAAG